MPLTHVTFFVSSCVAEIKAPTLSKWSANVSLDAQKQERRIFVTPDSHELVLLTVPPTPGTSLLVPLHWSLHNQIAPSARVDISPPVDIGRGDRFRYEYTVSNGPRAKENITVFFVAAPPFAPGTDADFYVNGQKNPLWMGSVGSALSARQRELDDSVARNIFWVSEWTEDLASSESVNVLPGHSKRGFVADSSLMPGFTTAAFQTPASLRLPDEVMDLELWREVDELRIVDYFDTTTLTFGPMFLPGAEPGDVLRNYRLGIERLVRCGPSPRGTVFLNEISQILKEPGIESRLTERLSEARTKPSGPIEVELLNCLRLVARAFESRGQGGKY